MRVDLVQGRAAFAGDLTLPEMLHLAYVRSPHAAARITAIDVSAAQASPGVAACFRAADLSIVPLWEIALVPERYAQPALADREVRYVGERVVAVLADSLGAALDAADAVVVDYEPVAAVTDAGDGEICLAWPSDVPGATFDGADVSVRVAHRVPRLSVAPMEGHAVLAVPGDGRLTLFMSTQVPTSAHRQVCRSLRLAPDRVRIVTCAVGGGFGGKAAGAVADHMIAGAAALALGRPVRFVEDRPANLITMQGRGVRSTVELHATRSGEVVGMRAEIRADGGAYPAVGAVEPGKTRMMLCGPYRLRAVDVQAQVAVTNLPPVGAYRGPGRSEASLMLERTMDVLAAELGVDPLELRRRNLIPPDALPYRTPTGVEYDSGDYPALLDRLAEIADYAGLRRQQAASRAAGGGSLLGVGLALVLDSTAWFSRDESAGLQLRPDGTVTVLSGSAPAGQGHDAVYRSVVRRVLPIDDADITVVEGDTDAWSASDGTMGSRTAQLAGAAVLGAAELLAARIRDVVADELEASPADVELARGGAGIRGVPATFRPLPAWLHGRGPIDVSCGYQQVGATYPAAAHLSVVELDTATGNVTPRRHVALTDCGRVLDAPSAAGQVIGATVQGIAQALYEEAVFDRSGTPLTTSMADYAVPSAADVPAVEVHFVESPSPRNPLGAKGVGEIGMLAAPVAVQNAVIDALAPFGVRHLDMPCTPERVWRAMRNHALHAGVIVT